MNCKHWGELIDERHFKEVAKLWLIFMNNKDCLEKVKKCYKRAFKAREIDFW